jgi:class 3 adenylate cyclase/DNA-binding SARP family transcriptional activator/tetratricopeptide (TPR) repeat protein
MGRGVGAEASEGSGMAVKPRAIGGQRPVKARSSVSEGFGMVTIGKGRATRSDMEFRVLGSLEVVGPGGPIAIASARQRAILALLVLDLGHTVASERVVDQVWGDDPPPTAQHALRVHVAGLRRALGAGRIETQPHGYRLRAEGTSVDLQRFQAIVSDASRAFGAGDPQSAARDYRVALALWRGPALGDLGGSTAARAERARLDELRAVVLERWVDAELASGRHLELLPALRSQVTEAPLREAFQARLMLALYRSGRQAEALAVYHAAREVLDRELGVEPGPELEALQRAVLAHDPAMELGDLGGPRVWTGSGSEAATRRERGPVLIEAAAAALGLERDEPRPDGRERTTEPWVSRHPGRRTVTILVAEVDGSAVGDLDPESTRRPAAEMFDELCRIVERHGGMAEPFIGDAVLGVFGVPTIHEDDALRAVRAAAEMRDAVVGVAQDHERDPGASISLRIGLSTGEIVIGEVRRASRVVTGDTVNIAARLAEAAAPGDALLGETTHRLVRHAAEVERAHPIQLRGVAKAVAAYRLRAVAPDIVGHRIRLDSPLVGRERELRQLQAALEQAIDDEACYLFSLLGPAGVGKSRLVHEFLGFLGPDALVLRGRCLPYGEQVAFWPIAEAVRQAAEIRSTDDAFAARQKLERLVRGDQRASLVAERTAGAIGLSAAPSAGDDTSWAIRTLFESLARNRPLLIVFDDVQWGEPTFLDLIDYLAETSRDAPILLLCIARPELLDERPGWGGGKLNASSVLLRPLSETDVSRLVTNLLGGLGVSPDVERKIGEAAEGNPLFVEEFLAMLVEDGTLRREGSGWVSTADLSSIVAPFSIMALLAARLDRLPAPERDVIERASVVGKVFGREALGALAEGLDATEVDAALSSLVRRELIRQDQSGADVAEAYRFKHILIRDAAYASVPKNKRIVVHELLAEWLGAGKDTSGLDAELIGAHLEQAYRYRTELGPLDDQARAVGRLAAARLADAGRQAHVRGDARLAEDLLKRAAAVLPARDPDRLVLLIDLTETLIDRGEFAAAFDANDELIEHAGPLGLADVRWRGVLQRFRLNFYTGRGQDPEARRDADAAIRFFGEVGNDQALGMAWRVIGELDNEAGLLAKSRRAYERAADHSSRAGDLRGEAVARAVIGGIDMFGPATVGAAMRTASSLLDWARATGQLATESIALAQLGRLKAMVGDVDEGRRLVYAAIDIAQDLGRRLHDADSSRWIGLVEWLAGDPVAAEAGLRRGYGELVRLGETRMTAHVGAQLARMLYLQGRLDEAHEYTRIAEAQQSSLDVETGIDWRSVRGLVLARRGETDAALGLTRDAVAIAQATDLVWARGRALEDLAEVLTLAGRPDEARPLLARAIGLYEQKGIIVLANRARRIETTLPT